MLPTDELTTHESDIHTYDTFSRHEARLMPTKGDILVEKYRLIRIIGKGGMGEIYEAEHVELGKRVAVKFLRREIANKPTNVKRLTQEAKAAATIGHKSIIDVYDIGMSLDDHVFVVMEFLDGESLRDRLKRKGVLDIPTAAYIVCQLLSALDASHKKNIIHRDIKPDNVFLVQARQVLPDVKLLDFGISKILDGSSAEDLLTKTGDVIGTPYYMAPEQAKGQKYVDRRCDIYSIGAILYECLSGRVPFVAENSAELLYKLLNKTIVPPSQLCLDVPPGLDDVIMRALSRNPDDRFSTAAEMFRNLLPFAGDQGANRVTLPEGLSEEDDSSEPSSVALDIQLMKTAQTEGSASSTSAPTETSKAPSEEEDSSRRLVVIGGGVALVVIAVVVGALLWPKFSSEAPASGASDAFGSVVSASSVNDADGERNIHDALDGDVVTITLENVPEEARVFFEGVRVDRSVLQRRRNPVLVELRVEVPGSGRWRRMISFDEDATIPVVLEPVDENAAAAPDRSTKGSRQPSKTKRSPHGDSIDEDDGRPGLDVETQFPGRKGGKGGVVNSERENP